MEHIESCYGHLSVDGIQIGICGISIAQMNKNMDTFIRGPEYKVLRSSKNTD